LLSLPSVCEEILLHPKQLLLRELRLFCLALLLVLRAQRRLRVLRCTEHLTRLGVALEPEGLKSREQVRLTDRALPLLCAHLIGL